MLGWLPDGPVGAAATQPLLLPFPAPDQALQQQVLDIPAAIKDGQHVDLCLLNPVVATVLTRPL